MKNIACFLALLTCGSFALAQTAPCNIAGSFTATGTSIQFDNRTLGCYQWRVNYSPTGFSALSIQLEYAPDVSGTPGTWVAFTGGSVVTDGSNPSTALIGTVIGVHSGASWVRLKLVSATGTGSIRYTVWGANSTSNIAGVSGQFGIVPITPNGTARRILGSGLSAGQNDLYTVPTGRRLFVLQSQAGQTAGATGTYQMQVKIGASYFNITGSTATALNVVSTTAVPVSIVLEAGDILSTFTSGTTLNVWAESFEFDNNSNLKSPRLAGSVAGVNTVYTVPTGKTAMVLQSNLSLAVGTLFFGNDSAGARTFTLFLGSAADTAHQVGVTASLAASAKGSYNLAGSMEAGDKILITPSTESATQLFWVLVLEG